jgi:hypothetical protein
MIDNISNLYRMNCEIQVGSITCDGVSYQGKTLVFHAPAAIQARKPEDSMLSRLLFIPCFCHRLNNADHYLLRESPLLNDVIDSHHAQIEAAENNRRSLP